MVNLHYRNVCRKFDPGTGVRLVWDVLYFLKEHEPCGGNGGRGLGSRWASRAKAGLFGLGFLVAPMA